MLWFHQHFVWVAVVSTGAVGLWGVGLAIARRPVSRAFAGARAAAISAILLQVGAGLWLFGTGRSPSGFHLFYGVLIVITLSFTYVYRSQLARRPALAYGLVLLFVMGLGIRAWIQVT